MSATSSAIPFVVFVQEKYATRTFPFPVVGSGSGSGVGFGVGSGVGSFFCMGSSLSWLHAHMVAIEDIIVTITPKNSFAFIPVVSVL